MNAPFDFAALEKPDKELPRFVIEPKDKDPECEVVRQARFRDLLRFDAPGVTSWGIPNAGLRGFKAQARALKEGLTAGVHDEHYAWNHGIAFLEWKDGKGMPSAEQIAWGNKMVERGFRVACVRSPTFAMRLFAEWGVPMRAHSGWL
jgi:hypothetical protein